MIPKNTETQRYSHLQTNQALLVHQKPVVRLYPWHSPCHIRQPGIDLALERWVEQHQWLFLDPRTQPAFSCRPRLARRRSGWKSTTTVPPVRTLPITACGSPAITARWPAVVVIHRVSPPLIYRVTRGPHVSHGTTSNMLSSHGTGARHRRVRRCTNIVNPSANDRPLINWT